MEQQEEETMHVIKQIDQTSTKNKHESHVSGKTISPA
jgi:hypothetical protein